MTLIARTFVFLLTLSGVADACACDLPAVPLCAVTVEAGQVVASFPILKPPFVWHWLRPETKDNDLEYRWQVEFGNCTPERKFEFGEFSYGVQLFKFPGGVARSGQLPTLLKQAQHTFMRRQLEGNRTVYSVVPGMEVSSRVDGAILEVTANGRDQIAQLLAALPKHALLTVNSPEAGASYTCLTQVQYAR